MLGPTSPVATPFLYHTLPVAELLVNTTVEVPPFSQNGCAVPLTVMVGVGGIGFTVIDSTSLKFAAHAGADGVALTVKLVDAVVGVTGIMRVVPLPPTVVLTTALVLSITW